MPLKVSGNNLVVGQGLWPKTTLFSGMTSRRLRGEDAIVVILREANHGGPKPFTVAGTEVWAGSIRR
jgi:hypothetical protein